MHCEKEFYVSPLGDDGNPGTEGQPFRTLKKARDVVRDINRGMEGDIAVCLRGGEYVLDSAFILTEEDSGHNGHTVVYRAYPGEKPVISGGKEITGWTVHDRARNIYRAYVGENVETRQVYTGGKRAVRARSADGSEWEFDKAGFKVPECFGKWKNIRELEVVGRYDWKLFRGKVDRMENGLAVMQEPFWNNSQLHKPWKLTKVDWVENAYELLDSEGEWYIDRPEGYLYYIPRNGEDMGSLRAVIPLQEALVKAWGVRNVAFRGLTFSYATWLKPDGPSGYCPTQAGCIMFGEKFAAFDEAGDFFCQSDGNIALDYAQFVAFEGNTFEHLGAAAIKLGRGCKYNTVDGNVFRDISGSAVELGAINDYYSCETDLVKGNRISNNTITDTAVEYEDCPAIFAGMTQETAVERNVIHDVSYTGVSIGWGWGLYDKKPTVQKGNRVTGNHIYNYMKTMMDGGGIYYLSASPYTLINYNYIHDAGKYCPGIYLDGGCRYISVENNVIDRMVESFSAQNLPNSDNVFRGNYYSLGSEFNVCGSNIAFDNYGVADGEWPEGARKIMSQCTELSHKE
jgi:hypothetical protein